MNVLFYTVFLLAAALVCVRDPSAFLPALLSGAGKAVAVCMTLAASYAVWMGFLKIAEDAGVLRVVTRRVKPLCKKLFRAEGNTALESAAVNLSANFLGMGGAATPAGISAMRLLGAERRAEYARAAFFVANCSGLQILPTTALALRVQAGSQNAYSVLVPVWLSCLCALLLGVLLVRLIYGRNLR